MPGLACGMPGMFGSSPDSMPGMSGPGGPCGPSGGPCGPAGGMGGMMPMMPMAPMMSSSCPSGEEQTGPSAMPAMMPGMMPGMGKGGMMMPNPMMMMMSMMMQAQMMKVMQGQQGQGGDSKDGAPSNPMAAMMGMAPMNSGNPMLGILPGAPGGSSSGGPPPAPSQDAEEEMDPEIRELGDYFNIEDRWVKRLNEAMRKRKDTKEQDLAKLYEVLDRARSPTGLLTVKIGEMESGQFVGKVKPDKDVERLARKFKLDEHVSSRLTELVVRRKSTKEGDLERIEQHLRYCKRPSAMATLLAGKLLEGEVDELPDLKEAEVLMTKYKLDEDARSKLREIVEKRAQDKQEVLAQVEKHLGTAPNPSSMLCKIARPLIDGEKLADPIDRPVRNPGGGGGDRLNPVAQESRSAHERDRRGGDKGERGDKDRDRRDRSKDRRDRGDRKRRSRSRSGGHW